MKKIIKIGEKDYTLKSSAYTQFKYKDDTGRRLLDDLEKISKIQNPDISTLEDITDIVLHMAYVMIEEADSTQVSSYDNFLKDIDNLYDNSNWITEIVELAISPISRGI